MRLGVLDVGSDSAQLQVVDVYPGAPPLPTHALKEPTLLGEAFEPGGSIHAHGVQRLVAAVGRTVQSADRFGVEELYVFTTAAVRDAVNRDLILAQIERVYPRRQMADDGAQVRALGSAPAVPPA